MRSSASRQRGWAPCHKQWLDMLRGEHTGGNRSATLRAPSCHMVCEYREGWRCLPASHVARRPASQAAGSVAEAEGELQRAQRTLRKLDGRVIESEDC
jgi:hypothetical protein